MFLAEEIIPRHIGPDHIVGAQHVERHRHVVSLKIAPFLHALIERSKLLLVDEHRHVAGIREVDERDQIGGAGDPVVAARGHIGKSRGEQRPAQAITSRVDRTFARRHLHRVEGRERTLLHVVLEALLGELLVGIDP